MPRPGFIWRHVTISTLNSWLHGDERGFRSRHHRIHSGGDYKCRPPAGEHEALRRYMKSRSGSPVIIPRPCRPIVASALVHTLSHLEITILAVSVNGCHAHLLAQLPREPAETRRIVGVAKSRASRAVRKQLPGRIWSAGGSYEPVTGREHQGHTFNYILDHKKEGAWVWSFRDGMDVIRSILESK